MTEITLTFCPKCLSTNVTARKCQDVELDLLGNEKLLSEGPYYHDLICKNCKEIACEVPIEIPAGISEKLATLLNEGERELLVSFCLLILVGIAELKKSWSPAQRRFVEEVIHKVGPDEIKDVLDRLENALEGETIKKIRAKVLVYFA